MENLKSKYDKVVEDRKKVIQELDELKENEFVKRYFELSKIDNKLSIEQHGLYTKIKIEEFSSCDHLWITCEFNVDKIDGHTERFDGCIKCGLNWKIFREDYNSLETVDERIMHYVLNSDRAIAEGHTLNEFCNLELGKAIYSKIIENNPNIDEETACKYFEIALNNIRNIEVNDDRKISRAKRLSLNPSFNKWNRDDIKNRK